MIGKIWPGLWRDVVLNSILASSLVPPRVRSWSLRKYGMEIGDRVYVSPRVWFGSKRVALGDGTFVNYGCRFNTTAPISIGERCAIGMDVVFITASHEIGPHERRAGVETAAPITVGSGVWIGARAVLLPGVTIGDGVVIASGAVVTRDCAQDGVYGGVPARRIRDLPDRTAETGVATITRQPPTATAQ